MKGLMLKEFLITRSYLKTYVVVLAVYMLISFTGNASMFASMVSVVLMVLPMSAFALDEVAKWDKFAAALPGGRRKMVCSKYQSLLALSVGSLILACAASLLVSVFGRDQSSGLPELMLTSVSCVAACLLLNCILFPFLFKYGAQKGRVILIAVIAVFFALLAMGFVLLKFNKGSFLSPLSQLSPVTIGGIGVAVLAAALAVSYSLSCRIYEKKEF